MRDDVRGAVLCTRVVWAPPCLQALQMRQRLLEGPSVVVADEAHEMRNATSQYLNAMMQLQTRRRIALTGYPLQVRALPGRGPRASQQPPPSASHLARTSGRQAAAAAAARRQWHALV